MSLKSATIGAIAAFFLFFALIPHPAPAEEKSEDEYWASDFFGISWELSGSFGTSAPAFDTVRVEALSLMATYGRAEIFRAIPLRLRLGLGWWKARPFMASAGLEIALLELLSPARARMTGLYVFSDIHLRASSTGLAFSFEPSARILIPLHGMGGIAVGIGYDTDLGLTWHLENMNGVYPLK